jgi:hypothetical protein
MQQKQATDRIAARFLLQRLAQGNPQSIADMRTSGVRQNPPINLNYWESDVLGFPADKGGLMYTDPQGRIQKLPWEYALPAGQAPAGGQIPLEWLMQYTNPGGNQAIQPQVDQYRSALDQLRSARQANPQMRQLPNRPYPGWESMMGGR